MAKKTGIPKYINEDNLFEALRAMGNLKGDDHYVQDTRYITIMGDKNVHSLVSTTPAALKIYREMLTGLWREMFEISLLTNPKKQYDKINEKICEWHRDQFSAVPLIFINPFYVAPLLRNRWEMCGDTAARKQFNQLIYGDPSIESRDERHGLTESEKSQKLGLLGQWEQERNLSSAAVCIAAGVLTQEEVDHVLEAESEKREVERKRGAQRMCPVCLKYKFEREFVQIRNPHEWMPSCLDCVLNLLGAGKLNPKHIRWGDIIEPVKAPEGEVDIPPINLDEARDIIHKIDMGELEVPKIGTPIIKPEREVEKEEVPEPPNHVRRDEIGVTKPSAEKPSPFKVAPEYLDMFRADAQKRMDALRTLSEEEGAMKDVTKSTPVEKRLIETNASLKQLRNKVDTLEDVIGREIFDIKREIITRIDQMKSEVLSEQKDARKDMERRMDELQKEVISTRPTEAPVPRPAIPEEKPAPEKPKEKVSDDKVSVSRITPDMEEDYPPKQFDGKTYYPITVYHCEEGERAKNAATIQADSLRAEGKYVRIDGKPHKPGAKTWIVYVREDSLQPPGVKEEDMVYLEDMTFSEIEAWIDGLSDESLEELMYNVEGYPKLTNYEKVKIQNLVMEELKERNGEA